MTLPPNPTAQWPIFKKNVKISFHSLKLKMGANNVHKTYSAVLDLSFGMIFGIGGSTPNLPKIYHLQISKKMCHVGFLVIGFFMEISNLSSFLKLGGAPLVSLQPVFFC